MPVSSQKCLPAPSPYDLKWFEALQSLKYYCGVLTVAGKVGALPRENRVEWA